MLEVSVRSNLIAAERTLTELARKQFPFAKATALTSLARKIQAGQQKALRRELDRPAPFTMKSIGVKAAKKNDLVATVYMRDIAASYLEPFEFGGVHKTNARAMFNPKGATLNQYGNLPRNMIARLKNRSDVFVGPIKTKSGEVINGVWQRPYIRPNQKFRGQSRLGRGHNMTGHLKLLIRFTDPQPVTQHLHYRERAKRTVAGRFDAEFRAAMAKALASARL